MQTEDKQIITGKKADSTGKKADSTAPYLLQIRPSVLQQVTILLSFCSFAHLFYFVIAFLLTNYLTFIIICFIICFVPTFISKDSKSWLATQLVSSVPEYDNQIKVLHTFNGDAFHRYTNQKCSAVCLLVYLSGS